MMNKRINWITLLLLLWLPFVAKGQQENINVKTETTGTMEQEIKARNVIYLEGFFPHTLSTQNINHSDPLNNTNNGMDSIREKISNNGFYVEAGGNVIIYSLNYDRMITSNLSVRMGIMFFPYPSAGTIMMNYLIGSENHKLEIGAGISYLSELTPTLTFGYRRQLSIDGLLFRIGFTPYYRKQFSWDFGGASGTQTIQWNPWFGISLGTSF